MSAVRCEDCAVGFFQFADILPGLFRIAKPVQFDHVAARQRGSLGKLAFKRLHLVRLRENSAERDTALERSHVRGSRADPAGQQLFAGHYVDGCPELTAQPGVVEEGQPANDKVRPIIAAKLD